VLRSGNESIEIATPSGHFRFNILVAFGQMEREILLIANAFELAPVKSRRARPTRSAAKRSVARASPSTSSAGRSKDRQLCRTVVNPVGL